MHSVNSTFLGSRGLLMAPHILVHSLRVLVQCSLFSKKGKTLHLKGCSIRGPILVKTCVRTRLSFAFKLEKQEEKIVQP